MLRSISLLSFWIYKEGFVDFFYYRILGLEPNATKQEINDAYVRSARTDDVNQAYRILSDDTARAAYDLSCSTVVTPIVVPPVPTAPATTVAASPAVTVAATTPVTPVPPTAAAPAFGVSGSPASIFAPFLKKAFSLLNKLSSLGCLFMWLPFAIVLGLFVSGAFNFWEFLGNAIPVVLISWVVLIIFNIIMRPVRWLLPNFLVRFASITGPAVRIPIFIASLVGLLFAASSGPAITHQVEMIERVQVQQMVQSLCSVATDSFKIDDHTIQLLKNDKWPKDHGVLVNFSVNNSTDIMGLEPSTTEAPVRKSSTPKINWIKVQYILATVNGEEIREECGGLQVNR